MHIKRNTRVAIGAGGALVLGWLALVIYADYWTPYADLQELGFEWIRPWTPRQINRESWIDGSQTIYRFEITTEQELALRQKCSKKSDATQMPCYVARKTRANRPTIDVEVQSRALVVYYTG